MNELKKDFLFEATKVVLGKEKEFTLALCAFLSNGHILIEDVPGVGKTTFAKTLARILDLNFSRIQFTSDLMPSDVIGSQVYNQKDHTFTTFKGPLFNQFILADELNRANPKTQSAMLEAMEEKQVSIDRETFKLPEPFFVVATQNPNTQIGTHLLPESQLDRFIIRIKLGYPHPDNEKILIAGFDTTRKLVEVKNLFDLSKLQKIKQDIASVKMSDKIIQYILDILEVTRSSNKFNSLSPRCGIDISKMCRAHAFLENRDYVLPDDVKAIIEPVVSHRLNATSSEIVSSLLSHVKVD
jgi:MoxR-like ATPase